MNTYRAIDSLTGIIVESTTSKRKIKELLKKAVRYWTDTDMLYRNCFISIVERS